jgi:Fe-S cluster assembly protein SufD
MPVLEEQNSFVADFEQAEKALAAVGPASLHRVREAALQRFAELGFPTTDQEEWRFTPLAPLTRTVFKPGRAAKVERSLLEGLAFVPANGPCLVFVNGEFAPALSAVQALPKDVVLTNFANAWQHHRERIEACRL